MCAHAWEATATAGLIGRKIATRSPGSTPSSTSASASCFTCRESSAHVSESREPSSPRQTAASSSASSVSAHLWTQLDATFSFPPTNHSAHSGPRLSSSTRSHGVENSSPRSSTTAGQKRSGSSIETRCNSA